MSRKRVIVVEDEQDIAELVAMRLRKEGHSVEIVGDGQEALARVRAERPDLVLLDIMLPGLSGTQVLRELRADPRTKATPVIMLTARSSESDQVLGLELGADDYITKPFSMSVLTAHVSAVLRRSSLAHQQDAITIGLLAIDTQRHVVGVAGRDLSLTPMEYRVLLALAAARGKVLTRAELIDQSIGLSAVVTDRTVDVHLTALRRKLGQARHYIKTVRGTGYRLSADHETT